MSMTILFTVMVLTVHCYHDKKCNYCFEDKVTGPGSDIARSDLLNKEPIVSCASPLTAMCNATRGEDSCKQLKSSVKVTGMLGETNMDIEYSVKRQACVNSTKTCAMMRKNMMQLHEMVMGVQDPKMDMMKGQEGMNSNGMSTNGMDDLNMMDQAKEKLQKMIQIKDLGIEVASCEMTLLSGARIHLASGTWVLIVALLAQIF